MTDPTKKGVAIPPSKKRELPLSPPSPESPEPPLVLSGIDSDPESRIITARRRVDVPAVDRETRMMSIGDFPAVDFIEAINHLARTNIRIANSLHWLIGILIALGAVSVIMWIWYAPTKGP